MKYARRKSQRQPIRLLLSVLQSPGRAMLLAVILAAIGYTGLQISSADTGIDSPSGGPAGTPPGRSAEAVASEQIIVRYRPGADKGALRSKFQAEGASESEDLEQMRMKILKVPAARRDAVIAKLRADSRFEFVEADAVIRPAVTTPNDPEYSKQWMWPKTATNQLWDKTKGSPAVTIAILDSGINASHPDFAGKLMAGYNAFSDNFDTTDRDSHGTVVASVVGAASNNGTGVAGGCWNCKIMPIKISADDGGGTMGTLAKGIDYAVANDVRLINISYGGTTPASVLKAAVDAAAGTGAIVVAGAGNDSKDAASFFPAAYDNAIAVAATVPDDKLAGYSNFGNVVDIAAPGEARGADNDSNGYVTMNGTSFAAPAVTSIIGLLWSAFPNATPAQIRSAIASTADGCCAGKIAGGRINAIKAYNALAAAVPAPADNVSPTITFASPAAGRSLSGTSAQFVPVVSDNVGVTRVHFSVDNLAPGVRASDPYFTALNTKLFTDGKHTVTMTAFDAMGNNATVTREFTLNNTTPADTASPTLTITEPAEGVTVSGTSAIITVDAADETEVSFVHLDIPGNGQYANDMVAPYVFRIDPSKLPAGPQELKFTVYDPSSHETAATRIVNVSHAPPLPGDLNGDGKVNITDLSVLLSNWAKTGTGVKGDINNSGKVDIIDLSILLSKWTV